MSTEAKIGLGIVLGVVLLSAVLVGNSLRKRDIKPVEFDGDPAAAVPADGGALPAGPVAEPAGSGGSSAPAYGAGEDPMAGLTPGAASGAPVAPAAGPAAPAGPTDVSRPAGPAGPAGTPGVAGSGREAPESGKVHVVRKGETLPVLARKYYGSSRKTDPIVKANPGVNFRKALAAGTRLVIPELPKAPTAVAATGRSASAALSSAAGGAAEPAEASPAARPAGRTHVVQPGDTLWSLADHYLGSGSRWTEIVAANPGMTRDAALKAGQRIAIPDARP